MSLRCKIFIAYTAVLALAIYLGKRSFCDQCGVCHVKTKAVGRFHPATGVTGFTKTSQLWAIFRLSVNVVCHFSRCMTMLVDS